MDFRSPSMRQIADFLLFLFQEKHLQPSTIDGYRTAIADKIGNDPVNISKDENLTRLLDSFHRDKPKGRRGIPSWNLSLVLHQLTKPPFEPLRKASPLRRFSCWLWARERGGVKFMPGSTRTLGIKRIGRMSHSILVKVLFPRTTWRWLLLWTKVSRRIGLFVQ